jgi:hypothetical protein
MKEYTGAVEQIARGRFLVAGFRRHDRGAWRKRR